MNVSARTFKREWSKKDLESLERLIARPSVEIVITDQKGNISTNPGTTGQEKFNRRVINNDNPEASPQPAIKLTLKNISEDSFSPEDLADWSTISKLISSAENWEIEFTTKGMHLIVAGCGDSILSAKRLIFIQQAESSQKNNTYHVSREEEYPLEQLSAYLKTIQVQMQPD